MKIFEKTLNELLSAVPPAPPETGGILGGSDQVVFTFTLDPGGPNSNDYDLYSPNTQLLNQTIKNWANAGIAFYGIFHSHFPGGIALSNGDIRYITQIMHSLPPQVDHLYFPIILPQRQIIVYRADKQAHAVHIVRDQIEIL